MLERNSRGARGFYRGQRPPTLILRIARVAIIGAAAGFQLAAPLRADRRVDLAGVDDRWRHFQSPNFELYSHVGESDSRQLLHDLELLRAVFFERLQFVERVRLEITVFAFASSKEFEAYRMEGFGRKRSVVGFYLARPDRAVIPLAPFDEDEGAQEVIFHEYVHHLFNASAQAPPVWFGEGMADLLAGLRVNRDTIEIGRPLPGRIRALQREQLLPLESLFAADQQSPLYTSERRAGLFYAQSWALLHYWHFGKSGLSRDGVARFTRIAGGPDRPAGERLRALFQECFGIDYPEMQRRLEKYMRSGKYVYGTQPIPQVVPAKDYAARAVPREEIRLRLAELDLRVNRSAMGKIVLLDAADDPTVDVRILEALGADAAMGGDMAAAAGYWNKAVAAGTSNVAIFRELALLEARNRFRQFNYDLQLPAGVASDLRSRLLLSIEHEPEQSEAYEMLAWVEAFADDDRSIGNVNLVQTRFPFLREKARTLVALAMVRVRTGRSEEALMLLGKIGELDPDGWSSAAAETIAARLGKRPERRPADTRSGPVRLIEIRPPTAPILVDP